MTPDLMADLRHNEQRELRDLAPVFLPDEAFIADIPADQRELQDAGEVDATVPQMAWAALTERAYLGLCIAEWFCVGALLIAIAGLLWPFVAKVVTP